MKLLFAILSTALAVRAHTIFQQIGINGQMAERHNYMRLPEYDGVSSLIVFYLIRTSILTTDSLSPMSPLLRWHATEIRIL